MVVRYYFFFILTFISGLSALAPTEDVIEFEAILENLSEEMRNCPASDDVFQAFIKAQEILKEIKDIYAAIKEDSVSHLAKIDQLKGILQRELNFIKRQREVCTTNGRTQSKEMTMFSQSGGSIRTPKVDSPIEYNLPSDHHQNISIAGIMPENKN
ncbi:MAG: hypothetical protein CNLJKLNK_01019 [Holosporales bacterium]